MASKTEKLLKVFNELLRVNATLVNSQTERDESGFPLMINANVINRLDLRKVICRTYDISEKHAVSSKIDYLLSIGAILPNPTSSLSANKQVNMPTNDTRYFIHKPQIELYLKRLSNDENMLNGSTTKQEKLFSTPTTPTPET